MEKTSQAILTGNFIRETKRLPRDVRKRVRRVLTEILQNPHAGTKLKGELKEYWRWRIGKYRVIYAINDAKRHVIFLDAGPRRAIYE